jgi:hypothetical protein
MLKIQYLGPEDIGSTVIQHQVIDDSQRRRKTGNLTTYPPNTHYCQTCHADTLFCVLIIISDSLGGHTCCTASIHPGKGRFFLVFRKTILTKE